MVITLTVIALLVQFVGVYALIIQTQQTQDKGGEVVDPVCQRGRQVYYDAFAKQQATRSRGRHFDA